jgi:glycosyltransferase involved in cell wall biosynthesis
MTGPADDVGELLAVLEASRRGEQEARVALAAARTELDAVRGYRSFRWAQRVRRLVAGAVPGRLRGGGGPEREAAGPLLRPGEGSAWEDLRAAHVTSRARMADPPRFTVVIVEGDGGDGASTRLSLVHQTWPPWSVASVGPGPELPGAAAAIAAGLPPRTPMLILGAGDLLDPGCLHEVATALYRDPLLDLVCWDDVEVCGASRRLRCRPGWAPDALLTAPYLGTAACLRAAVLARASSWPARSAPGLVWAAALSAAVEEERAANLCVTLSESPSAGPDSVETMALLRCQLGERATVHLAGGPPVVAKATWSRPEACSVSLILTGDDRPSLERLWARVSDAAPTGEVVAVGPAGVAGGLGSGCSFVEAREHTSLAERRRLGAATGHGDVLVLIDAAVLPPAGVSWIDELAALARRPGVGGAGPVVVDTADRIVEAGVVVGMGRLAGRRLSGATGASLREAAVVDPTATACAAGGLSDVSGLGAGCLAVRRDLLTAAGPLDGREGDGAYGLVLGTRLRRLGRRCVITGGVRVVQVAALREPSSGSLDEEAALYWVIQRELLGGDPHWSPRLSLLDPVPRLRDSAEPGVTSRLEPILRRPFAASGQRMDSAEAYEAARRCTVPGPQLAALRGAQRRRPRARSVPLTVTWFIPGIETPFYGGIHTALRIADRLVREHGVRARFACWQGGPEAFTRSALAAAFPSLAGAELFIHDGSAERLAELPASDIGVATFWITAYQLAALPQVERKFYLIQDFEPAFYPAGTLYALTEETYRLGLFGICNTEHLADIYRHDFGGTAMGFTPAVDTAVFHARGRAQRRPGDPLTVFVYARPGHWRNCWELASVALGELKHRHGSRLRLVTAGAWQLGSDPEEPLFLTSQGLLDYASTADLYRGCDLGLALTVSCHPSYLPLELMACGTPVVAFDNPHGRWLLQDGENARLCELNASGLVEAVEELMDDPALRERLRAGGLRTVAAGHADWDRALAGIHDYLVDPGP